MRFGRGSVAVNSQFTYVQYCISFHTRILKLNSNNIYSPHYINAQNENVSAFWVLFLMRKQRSHLFLNISLFEEKKNLQKKIRSDIKNTNTIHSNRLFFHFVSEKQRIQWISITINIKQTYKNIPNNFSFPSNIWNIK